MRVTIIREDNAVNVGGVRHAVDCSGLPAEIHAIQWDGVNGEIEYVMEGRHKKPNAFITEFTPYASYVNAWAEAKLVAEAKTNAA